MRVFLPAEYYFPFVLHLSFRFYNYFRWLEFVIQRLVFLAVLVINYYAAIKNQLVFVLCQYHLLEFCFLPQEVLFYLLVFHFLPRVY